MSQVIARAYPAFFHLTKGGCRAPEFTTDEDSIPGTCARAKNRFTFRRFPDNNNVSQDPGWRLSCIPSGQRGAVSTSKFCQPSKKGSDPRLGQVLGKSKR